MRKFLTLIASLAIVLATAAPVSAAWPQNAECDHLASGNYHGGVYNMQHTGQWITSVKASIYGDTGRFQPCYSPFLNEPSGVSQWVAIDAPTSGSTRTIIQIGMMKCGYTTLAQGPCASGRTGTLRYFYAYGHDNNCELDPGVHDPFAIDLGAVPTTPAYHTFQITKSRTNGAYNFYIDGTHLPFSIPEYKVCWANNPDITRANWDVERWDPGDGFGSTIGPAWFTQKKFAYELGSLITAPNTISDCVLAPEFHCGQSAPDNMNFWTVQQ